LPENNVNPFGALSRDIAPIVSITPFLSINKFAKIFDAVEKEFKGIFFYKGITGQLKNKRITVINTLPSGNLAGDAVLFLKETIVSHFIFAGSFGSLGKIPVGAMTYVKTSCKTKDFFDYLANNSSVSDIEIPTPPVQISHNLPSSRILSVSSLYSELDAPLLTQFKDSGIDGLDMESAGFLAALTKTKKEGFALLFNADYPLERSIFQDQGLSRNGATLTDNFIKKTLELVCLL